MITTNQPATVAYKDRFGYLTSVSLEDFLTKYNDGEISPAQSVSFLNASVAPARLAKLVEEAEVNAVLVEAMRQERAEWAFQKKAPWYLKRPVRYAITLCLIPVAVFSLFIDERGPVFIWLAWLIYWHLGNGKKYNTFYELLGMSEEQDIIFNYRKERWRRFQTKTTP